MNVFTQLLTGGPRKPWVRPTFDQPMPIDPRQLTALGQFRGRQWYSHATWGEFTERPKTIREDDPSLPNGPVIQIQVGLERHFRVFDGPHEPGTLARLSNTPLRAPKPPKPHRPVDAMAHLAIAASRPERIAASPVGVGIRPAEAAARGPVAILERLDRAGVTVRPSTDGAALVVATSGGHLVPGVLELVDRAGPLLVAHFRGEPLTCTVAKHKTPQPAVSIALGGAPMCAECLDGAA